MITTQTKEQEGEYYNDVRVYPSNNKFNSARLEYLKSQKDHFLYDQDELRICNKCGELYFIHIAYYYDWSDNPQISFDIIKPNDLGGNNGLLAHLSMHRREVQN